MSNNGRTPRMKSDPITIHDVAQEAGVSYSTVSRVLSGYEFVKDSTRQKVLEAAQRLGYVVNMQARTLAGGKSNIVGLLVPGLDNSYVGEIVRGVDEELAKVGYDLLLYTTHRNKGKESDYVAHLTRGLSAGLLLIVPLVPAEYVSALQKQQFPYVLIDQSDPFQQSSVVDSTNWQGAYEATEHLIQLGHTRIGFITGLMALSSAGQRLDGYKAALADHNIPFERNLVAEGDFWQPGGYRAAEKLLARSDRPSAIFASNDLMAFGAMEAIRNYGLRIPDDISIVGFDDIPQASLVYPQLTTVRQPLDQMGRVAVRMLIEQIEQEVSTVQRVTLSTELVVRDSCKSRS